MRYTRFYCFLLAYFVVLFVILTNGCNCEFSLFIFMFTLLDIFLQVCRPLQLCYLNYCVLVFAKDFLHYSVLSTLKFGVYYETSI